jgi:hypothetical protein
LALLERLRITLAVLEWSESTGDLRFFNAALKLVDWLYRDVRRLKLPSEVAPASMVPVMIGVYYVTCVGLQERLLEEASAS